MAYDNNTPLPNEKVRTSQPKLRENFTQIKDVFEINHQVFNNNNAGRHTAVTFVDTDVLNPALPDGDVQTDVDEFGMYTKISPRTGLLELFTRRANNGTIYGITEARATAEGYAMTSSGLLIQWGVATANGVTQWTFPNIGVEHVAYPTIILAAYFTVITPGADADRFVELINFPDLMSFRVFAGVRTQANTAGAADFYWTTIGF